MNRQKTLSILFSLAILIFFSCSSEDNNPEMEEQNPPNILTLELSDITINSVQSGGLNIDNKESEITDKGICWSLNTEPTIDDFKLSDGDNSSQDFNLKITGLDENTTYYLRAYATNKNGTGYGNELTFKTKMNIDAPCTPQTNSIIFDSSTRNFSGSFYTSKGLFYGDYGLMSSGIEGDLSIEFSSPPEEGVYTISSDPFFMNSSECAVTGVFKIFGDFLSHRYTAQSETEAVVYVEKTETDKYSISFCNLSFASGSISFTFSGSNGNLTETF